MGGTGAAGLDSMSTWKAVFWSGGMQRDGRLGRADKGGPSGPKLTHHSPSQWRGRLTISSADTNSLISQLISDSKQQIPDGGRNSGVAN